MYNTINYANIGVFPLINSFQTPQNAFPIMLQTPMTHEYQRIEIKLPTYEYQPEKFVLIPFDVHKSNFGRFETIDEAITYIVAHCIKHHGTVSRQLAYTYAKFCQILSLYDGGYLRLTNIDKKIFYNAFNKYNKKNM